MAAAVPVIDIMPAVRPSIHRSAPASTDSKKS
jgi:hypothetical protein